MHILFNDFYCRSHPFVTPAFRELFALQVTTRSYLVTSLSLWMKHVSEDKLQTFADLFMISPFEVQMKTLDLEMSDNILLGLTQAMNLPNPPQHSWSFLCKTIERLYQLLPDEIQVKYSQCLTARLDHPEKIFHVICNKDLRENHWICAKYFTLRIVACFRTRIRPIQ